MSATCPAWALLCLTVIASCSWRGDGVWAAPFPNDPIPIKHWGDDEGFPPGSVNAILQTRDRYLWFGTTDGLVRFNGREFAAFNSRTIPGIRVNNVTCLLQDQGGRLWAGTSGGGLLRRETNAAFRVFGLSEGLANEQITALALSPKGVLWVGTDGGGLFTLEGDRFKAFGGNKDLPSPFISALLFRANGSLWVGTNARVCRIRNGVVERVGQPLGDEVHGHALLEDVNRVLYLASAARLYRWNEPDFEPVLKLNVNDIRALGQGADQRLWVGTANGLFRYERGEVSHISSDQGLAGNFISSIYRDVEGSLWIGSEGAGVDQVRRTAFASLSTRQGLLHPVCTSVCQDQKGSLWIGTQRGLNQITNGTVRSWTRKDGLASDMVFSVCEGAPGEIWIGTNNGLNRMSAGRIEKFGRSNGLPAVVIWSLYKDPAGTVWAGTFGGLVRVSRSRMTVFDSESSGLSHNDVRCMEMAGDGTLWVGTSHGLNHLIDGKFVSYVKAKDGQPINVVLALHAEANGDLWAGTVDGGLLRYRNGVLSRVTEKNGLFDNVVYAILEDGSGNLWMTSDRGVCRVSKSELNAFADGKIARIHSQAFGKADGLPSLQCTGTLQPSAWKTRDGRLWFATQKGVAVVDAEHLPRNWVAPKVCLERIVANGREAKWPEKLGPELERLAIHYVAPSFISPERVKYKYRMLGLDAGWSEPAAEGVAQYTSLAPGSYEFEVAACNEDGIWSEQPASVSFAIVPAWWQTLWFRGATTLAAILAIAGLTWLFSVRRHRWRMAELQRKHALERERNRIARDMHDGLGSELVKISMLGEVAESLTENADPLNAHLKRISGTARNALRDMEEIVWAVNPKNDTLEDLASYLCQFARELFEFSPTRLRLDVPAELPMHPLSAEVRHNLFLFAKEALNNAAKHGQALEVRLTLAVERTRLSIEVNDNGCGINSTASARQGNGLKNLEKRAEQIGGVMKIQSSPGGGTRVSVQLDLTRLSL